MPGVNFLTKIQAWLILAFGLLILCATLASWTGFTARLTPEAHAAADSSSFLTGMVLVVALIYLVVCAWAFGKTKKDLAAATRLALTAVPVLVAIAALGWRRERAPLTTTVAGLALAAYGAVLLRKTPSA